MATAQDVKDYIGDDDFESEALINACLDESVLLVDKYVGEATVPEAILDRAYIVTAADLYYRRQAPNGVMNQQFVGVDGIPTTPVRIARDPMSQAYGLLRRWVLPF
jgi:hypothetical protein